MSKIFLTILVVGVVAAAVLFFPRFQPPRQPHVQIFKCANLLQSCQIPVNGQTMEVKFSGAPSALKPFVLTVKAKGVKEVSASFKMVDMEMGLNKYRLIPVQADVWEGKVILPLCVAGRRDWILILTLDDANIQLPFST